jgi:hypothetical protein
MLKKPFMSTDCEQLVTWQETDLLIGGCLVNDTEYLTAEKGTENIFSPMEWVSGPICLWNWWLHHNLLPYGLTY